MKVVLFIYYSNFRELYIISFLIPRVPFFIMIFTWTWGLVFRILILESLFLL